MALRMRRKQLLNPNQRRVRLGSLSAFRVGMLAVVQTTALPCGHPGSVSFVSESSEGLKTPFLRKQATANRDSGLSA